MSLFMVATLEDLVPSEHSLRPVRTLVNTMLVRLNGLFNTIYPDSGSESISPEKLIRAMLLQVFYSVRSERQLVEQLHYSLLLRCFTGFSA